MSEEEKEEIDEELDVTSIAGVGAVTKQKLNDAGIFTILDLATAGPSEISEATDWDITKSVDVNNKARKRLVEMGRLEPDFVSASDLLIRRNNITRISTGSKNIDDLLGGGIETWAITEFYGEFGAGKCVAGDTNVVYTNDELVHLETISETYEKYSAIHGEVPYDDGFIVPLSTVKVVGYDLEPVRASHIYREKVRSIVALTTKRGRVLKLTRPHKLLTLTENGVEWLGAGRLRPGDAIATPRTVKIKSNSQITADDAYFLGFFVAEGSANPLSISNSDGRLVEWVRGYLESKHGFSPTIQDDDRSPGLKSILLRKQVRPMLGTLCESNSYTKCVPESILNGDEDVLRSFLAGYAEGDGHVAEDGLEFSSNSKKLIEGISYLLSRLGIAASSSVKQIETGPHFRLRVSGFDRAKIREFPFKSKRAPVTNIRNSTHGTPLAFYLKRVYRDVVSANRWHLQRKGTLTKSGTLYELLTRSAYGKKGISDETLKRAAEFFETRRLLLQTSRDDLATLDMDDLPRFRNFALSLPFPLSAISGQMGLTKSATNNYLSRGVPSSRRDAVRENVSREIARRIESLEDALATIIEAMKFNWDVVIGSKDEEYNDYVYDLVVPGKHAFVGGNLPTIMHNTQICHTLCCMVQQPIGEGGLDGGVVYIDTEGTFRPERVSEIATARGYDPDLVLSRIMVARAYNSAHQELIVKDLGRIIEKNNVKLVVVDSAVAHYRAEFLGRGTLAERQQRLNRFMHAILRTAEVYNIAVVMTNQVQSAPDSFFGDPTRATGGHVVAHTSTYRIYLRKAGKNRIARMIDSPYHPERDAVFMLDERGIDDPPEESTKKR